MKKRRQGGKWPCAYVISVLGLKELQPLGCGSSAIGRENPRKTTIVPADPVVRPNHGPKPS